MPVDLNRIIQAAAEAALEDQGSPRSRQQDGNQRKRKGLTAPRALLVGAGLATVARAATQKKLPRIAKFGLEKLVDVPNLRDLSDAVRDRLADLLPEDKDDQDEPDDVWDEQADDEDEDYGDDEPDDYDDEPPEDEAEEDWDEEQEDSDDDEPRDEEEGEPRDEEEDEPRDEEEGEPRDEEEDEPRDEEEDEPWDEEDWDDNGDAEPDAGDEGDWDDEAGEGDQEFEAPGIELGSENGDAAQRAARGFEAASQSGRGRLEAPELMQILGTPHSPPPALRRARRQDPVKRPPQPAPRSRKEERAGDPRRGRSSNSHSNSDTKKPAGRKQKTGRD